MKPRSQKILSRQVFDSPWTHKAIGAGTQGLSSLLAGLQSCEGRAARKWVACLRRSDEVAPYSWWITHVRSASAAERLLASAIIYRENLNPLTQALVQTCESWDRMQYLRVLHCREQCSSKAVGAKGSWTG